MTTNFSKEFRVTPGQKVHLEKYDPEETLGWKKGHKTNQSLEKALEKLDRLQYLLYAERTHAVLVVLQAIDAGGKDGTIRHCHVRREPAGLQSHIVQAVPSTEEAAHDFLWRVHKAVPGYGEIGIFNRSHYEDVLVVRVHLLVPKVVWLRRYTNRSTASRRFCSRTT